MEQNHGTLRHGYKAHIATDTRGIVIDRVFHTAKVHDSRHIGPLTAGEVVGVYADSAYSPADQRRRLRQRGVGDRIVHRRVRGQARLTPSRRPTTRPARKCGRSWSIRGRGW